MEKINVIISVVYVVATLIQILYNLLKNSNNREKRSELHLLEFQQRVLNLLVHDSYLLNDEIETLDE